MDQWVEEQRSTGGLQTALTNAQRRRASIFTTAIARTWTTCSTFGATALGISFNQFETLIGEAGNDNDWV